MCFGTVLSIKPSMFTAMKVRPSNGLSMATCADKLRVVCNGSTRGLTALGYACVTLGAQELDPYAGAADNAWECFQSP